MSDGFKMLKLLSGSKVFSLICRLRGPDCKKALKYRSIGVRSFLQSFESTVSIEESPLISIYQFSLKRKLWVAVALNAEKIPEHFILIEPADEPTDELARKNLIS